MQYYPIKTREMNMIIKDYQEVLRGHFLIIFQDFLSTRLMIYLRESFKDNLSQIIISETCFLLLSAVQELNNHKAFLRKPSFRTVNKSQ